MELSPDAGCPQGLRQLDEDEPVAPGLLVLPDDRLATFSAEKDVVVLVDLAETQPHLLPILKLVRQCED